ncbi:MAG: COQ9 family protein [Pseudomonadota bacterium]
MQTPSERLRERWLAALLPLVETRGWTSQTLAEAAQTAGLSEGEQALAAPGGVNDLIDAFFDAALSDMAASMANDDLSVLRTHERVAEGLKRWLGALNPHRKAVHKAAARGLLPWGARAATKRVWTIADKIWLAAGDTASDYNRETKRALLSTVIPSVVWKWLRTDDEAALDRHIAHRLNLAMRFGQAGSKVLKPVLDRFARPS